MTQELVAALEKAIRDTEFFRRHEATGLDALAERRRTWLSGKHLHIVGGREADWADSIRVECGLDKVSWYPSELHKAPKLNWADHLSSAHDVVVCIIDHIGHKTSGPLKDKCSSCNVPFVPADFGKRSVLDALADVTPEVEEA